MGTIRLRAPAKINWTLDIKGRRPDGYHLVEMLMQSISLWDEVVLTECSDGIHISSNSSEMPLDESNLAAKAARLIIDGYGIDTGIHIEISKNIPIAAGLAGGSSNAAAVLEGLNRLWGLGIDRPELTKLGTRLGADVPFCMVGGTAVARGIGEQLTILTPLERIWMVLVKPPFGVSTASVYQGLDLKSVMFHPDWKKVYKLLQVGRLSALSSVIGNLLEPVTEACYPEVGKIKGELNRTGSLVSMMTGSGPTVFGVFQSSADAEAASKILKLLYAQVYVVSTYHSGVEVIEGGSL